MLRILTLSAVAISALALSAHSIDAQQVVGRGDRVFTTSAPVGTGGAVRIFASVGDITITEGSGSTVEFRAEKDTRRGKVEDAGFIVLRDGDGVTICAVFDDDDRCDHDGLRSDSRSKWNRNWRDRVRLTMTVTVPRGARLHTSSGNGDVSLQAAVAEAKVRSGNGKVRIADVTGWVDASSGNGDVRVTMDRLTGNEDMEFTSGNGRIEVIVPSDFSADVEANTGNGRISTDFPITIQGKLSRNRLRGTIGNGGRRLKLSTGNGSMEIRKRM